MKKVVRASSNTAVAERAHDLLDYILDQGVSEHDMLEYLYDSVTTDGFISYLVYVADLCDIDIDQFDDLVKKVGYR